MYWLCAKVLGLGDVSQGGLGSFSLANMVIAHLQEEEKVCATPVCYSLPPVDTSSVPSVETNIEPIPVIQPQNPRACLLRSSILCGAGGPRQ
jgi:hypothetical protein